MSQDGKLWWPHTEALYALVYAYTLTEDATWLAWLQKVHDYSYRVFCDTEGEEGEWFGYANRDGTLAHTCKGGNYKGAFHVPRGLLMCVQKLDQFLATKK